MIKKTTYRYVYLLTYFDPEPLAYVVGEAEMEKKEKRLNGIIKNDPKELK